MNSKNFFMNNLPDISPLKLSRQQKFARRLQMKLRHQKTYKSRRFNMNPKSTWN
jgi:hypothetical protein